MKPSPFTSQGYPFSKELLSYDAHSLGRAFFADGIVTERNELHLFDHAELVAGGSLRHAPCLYAGRQVPMYVYTSTEPAEVADKYERLSLQPVEVGVFVSHQAGQVEFRIKLGSTLLQLARQPSAEAVRELRAERSAAELQGQAWSVSWLLELFTRNGQPLLDPLNVQGVEELAKAANPIISRREQPAHSRGSIPTRYKAGVMDVVVGLFFDGTGNNRYAAELIYNRVLDDKTGRIDIQKLQDYVRKKPIPHPILGENQLINKEDYMFDYEQSYLNPYSNIVLLHDLYQTQDFAGRRAGQPVVLKHYVQGIGTLVELDKDGVPKPVGYFKDDRLGSATGQGKRGVEARVEQALAHVAGQLQQLQARHGVVIGRVTFDVFGFSRGAAAARYCINSLLQPADEAKDIPSYGLLGKVLRESRILFPRELDVRFAGLFDTVVSDSTAEGALERWRVEYPLAFIEPGNILYDLRQEGKSYFDPRALGKGTPLHTSLKKLKGKAMHIIAKDEYRLNFPLTVSDAPDNYNLYLYGSHSDIGGGYAETPSMAVVEYADARVVTERADLDSLEATARSYCKKFLRRWRDGKWVADTFVTNTSPVSAPAKAITDRRQIVLEKSDVHMTYPVSGTGGNPGVPQKISDHYLIVDKGFVSNKMSLVAFNAMLQYALLQKLPFQPDPKKAKVKHPEFYQLPEVPYLKKYYDAVEQAVKDPKSNELSFPPEVLYPLYEHYVHSSANYNKAIVTEARGMENNIYPNELNVEEITDKETDEKKSKMVKVRKYLAPDDRQK